ncbi:MAG: hypothetical protein LBV74_20770 [Tannerella sp.]|jgi:hypothetical protein|nr:hypothetical protein [Tannerella sp.]
MKKLTVLLLLLNVSILSVYSYHEKEITVEQKKKKDTLYQKLSMGDKLYGLSNLWYDIKNIERVDEISINIDSLYYACIKRMLTTKNDPEYYRQLTWFLGTFFYQYPAIFTDEKQFLRKKYIPDYEWNIFYSVDIQKAI